MSKIRLVAVAVVLAVIAALLGIASMGSANATGNGGECVPTEGHYTEWNKTGFTPVQHGGDPVAPGEDTDTKKYVGPLTWEHQLTEGTPATESHWENVGWYIWTGGPRDSAPDLNDEGWHGPQPNTPNGAPHDAEPGNVYSTSDSQGRGSWFKYDGDFVEGTPGTDPTFETDSKFKVYEREFVPGNDCPPDDPEICAPDFEQGPGTADDMWEITWGQQAGSNGTATFNMQSFGGLVALNGAAVPGYMTPDWTWLYVTRAQDGRVLTYDFADGTRITATVSIPEGDCPSVTWVTGSIPNEPEVVDPITPPVLDPCGLDNAVWDLTGGSPSNFFTQDLDDNGVLTLIAVEGYVFPGGLSEVVLGTAPDSGELCPTEQPDPLVEVTQASSYACGDSFETVTTTTTTTEYVSDGEGGWVLGEPVVENTSQQVAHEVVACDTPEEPEEPKNPPVHVHVHNNPPAAVPTLIDAGL